MFLVTCPFNKRPRKTDFQKFSSLSFPLPKYAVSMVHGKMKPAEKEAFRVGLISKVKDLENFIL